MKLRKAEDGVFLFWCPGCDKPHPYHTGETPGRWGGKGWDFNGDLERPTFTPSLLVYPSPVHEDGTQYQKRCHLFLTAGVLHFCGDSDHALAGQSVPLPEWPIPKDVEQ
jgi:hypothetical protein